MLESEVYRIKKTELDKRIWVNKTRQYLMQIIIEKHKWRMERFDKLSSMINEDLSNKIQGSNK